MHYLFEKSDSLQTPMECFVYDGAKEVFPVRPHWHYFAEFLYLLRGECEVTFGEETDIVEEGEMVMFPPACVHSIFSADGTPPLYAVLKVDLRLFSGEAFHAPSPADVFSCAQRSGMPLHFDGEMTQSVDARRIFLSCVEEMRGQSFGYEVILRAQISRLLYGIIRKWTDAGLVLSDIPAMGFREYTIESITEYIDSRLEEALRVQDLAGLCHMSYSAFAAKFRAMHGVGCKEYVDRMRILRSEDYLLFTEHDLNFISGQLGFADCSHFIRCFKKYKGTTPGQFRLRKQPRKTIQTFPSRL